MKRLAAVMAGIVLLTLASGAMAFMGRMGMGGGMMGGMGPGMMPDATCPGMAAAPTTAVTAEKAKELAKAYADEYLKGFSVEKVLPVGGGFHTMYSVELKGPNDEVRVLHVNPFGTVMPFGGPWRRGA